MGIFLVRSDVENYQWLAMVEVDKHLEVEDLFIDRSSETSWPPTKLENPWKPVDIEILLDDESDNHLPSCDFPHLFNCALVFSAQAVKVLGTLLTENGELLSLRCKQGDYVVFNITTTSDALNLKASDIVYFSSGSVMDIKHFVFDAHRLPKSDIFRIPQIPTAFFVSERFKSEVEKHSLTGFIFREVEVQ